MADSCANLCSTNSSQILVNSLLDITNDSVNMITNNDDTKELSLRLSKDENGWLWKRNLSQLKSFVSNELNLNGKWSSPGGKTKVFKNSQITLKWTGQTRGKFIMETDNKVVQVAKTCTTNIVTPGLTPNKIMQLTVMGLPLKRRDLQLLNLNFQLHQGKYMAQDAMCSRLNEVISYDNKILRMEAEINRVRFECENKIEILSRNSCDISLEHKYESCLKQKGATQKRRDSTNSCDSTKKARLQKKCSIVRFFCKFNLSLLLSFIV